MTAALLVAVRLQTIAASAQTRAERICRAQQLKSSTPLGPDGGAGNSANVFQVTNDSPQVCTLNGVPHVRPFDERNRRISLKICANLSGLHLSREGEQAG
jgi:hypothetical protein